MQRVIRCCNIFKFILQIHILDTFKSLFLLLEEILNHKERLSIYWLIWTLLIAVNCLLIAQVVKCKICFCTYFSKVALRGLTIETDPCQKTDKNEWIFVNMMIKCQWRGRSESEDEQLRMPSDNPKATEWQLVWIERLVNSAVLHN